MEKPITIFFIEKSFLGLGTKNDILTYILSNTHTHTDREREREKRNIFTNLSKILVEFYNERF